MSLYLHDLCLYNTEVDKLTGLRTDDGQLNPKLPALIQFRDVLNGSLAVALTSSETVVNEVEK